MPCPECSRPRNPDHTILYSKLNTLPKVKPPELTSSKHPARFRCKEGAIDPTRSSESRHSYEARPSLLLLLLTDPDLSRRVSTKLPAPPRPKCTGDPALIALSCELLRSNSSPSEYLSFSVLGFILPVPPLPLV